jgi:hypothetical protein
LLEIRPDEVGACGPLEVSAKSRRQASATLGLAQGKSAAASALTLGKRAPGSRSSARIRTASNAAGSLAFKELGAGGVVVRIRSISS